MNRFQYVLNHTKAGMAVWSTKDNRFKFMNTSFARIHGYESNELLSADTYRLFAPESLQRFAECENNPSCFDTGDLFFETIHFKKDGLPIPLSMHVTIIKDDKNVVKHFIAHIVDLSHHKKLDTALAVLTHPQESELYRSIVQNLPGFSYIFKLHQGGNKEEFLYASDKILDIYGIEASTVLSDITTLRKLFHPDDVPHFKSAIAKSAQTLEPFHAEFRINHPQKGIRWLESMSKPTAQADESIVWHGITTDVTERKEQEEQLRQKEAEFRTLTENSPDTIARFDLECRRTYVNPAFERMFGHSLKEILGKKPSETTPIPDSLAFEQHLQKVLQTGKAYEAETPFIHAEGWQGVGHIRIVPEFDNDGHIMSVMCIGRDITELKQMEQKIVQQKILQETMLETLTDIGFNLAVIENGKFIYTNGLAWIDEFGHDDTSIKSLNFFDFVHPDDKERVIDMYHRRLAGEDVPKIYEVSLLNANGDKRIHELSVSLIPNTNPIQTVVVSKDITERKQMEEALSLEENKFRALAEHTPDTIARYDRECIRTYANPAFAKAIGVSAEELIGKKPTSYFMSTQSVVYENAIKRVFKSGNGTQIEYAWPDKAGKMIMSHIRIVPERNKNGEIISVIATGRDITQLKEYETQLKQNETRLKEAQKIAKIGNWEMEFPGLQLYWSDEVYRIFEITQGEFEPSYDHFLNIIHPEERLYVDMKYHASLVNQTPHDVTYRILLDDGKIKHIHEIGETTYDKQGNPLRAIGTIQDITEQKNIEKQMEHMAHHDALTGLPNRNLAKERALQIIAHAKRSDTKAAFLFIDLDGFKVINDTLGHSAGDAMLKTIATRLKECVRESDTISRQGGDEFLVILSDVTDNKDIHTAVEKILRKLEKSFEINTHTILTSGSIGIALYPDHGDSFETLLQNADTAMYQAKESGKNGYQFYHEKMNQNLIGQFKIQNDLKSALQNSEFVLFYQPQIDLSNSTIIGVEALIRWQHPTLGMIPPMDFIPIAENSGIIVQIGEWVIQEACAQAARWHNMGIEITVAINISAVQFKRGNLETIVNNALASSKIDPKYLELELTESIMMHNVESTLQTVQNLKSLGIQLSIDDFGTGYSSLAYLKRFAVDKLKIDQSFVRDILQDQDDAIIVQTIVQMAKSLGLKTIAEGVENHEVLNVIKSYGCDEVQGYHFAKPMGTREFNAYYELHNQHYEINQRELVE